MIIPEVIITEDDMPDLCYDILEDFSKKLGFDDYVRFVVVNELTYELRYDMSTQYEYHVVIHDHYYRNDMKFFEFVGFFGDLEFIKWLNRNGGEVDLVFLGQNGKIDVVKWAHHFVDKWNYKISLYIACQNGHVELAKWLHANGCG